MASVQILVIRVSYSKEPTIVNSKPCINCINYMKSLGIKKLYYSNDQGEIIYEKIKEIYTEHISQFGRKISR